MIPKRARLDMLAAITVQKLLEEFRECRRCKKPLPKTTPRSPVELEGGIICAECFFDDPIFGAAFTEFKNMDSNENLGSDDCMLISKRVVN